MKVYCGIGYQTRLGSVYISRLDFICLYIYRHIHIYMYIYIYTYIYKERERERERESIYRERVLEESLARLRTLLALLVQMFKY